MFTVQHNFGGFQSQCLSGSVCYFCKQINYYNYFYASSRPIIRAFQPMSPPKTGDGFNFMFLTKWTCINQNCHKVVVISPHLQTWLWALIWHGKGPWLIATCQLNLYSHIGDRSLFQSRTVGHLGEPEAAGRWEWWREDGRRTTHSSNHLSHSEWSLVLVIISSGDHCYSWSHIVWCLSANLLQFLGPTIIVMDT